MEPMLKHPLKVINYIRYISRIISRPGDGIVINPEQIRNSDLPHREGIHFPLVGKKISCSIFSDRNSLRPSPKDHPRRALNNCGKHLSFGRSRTAGGLVLREH